jgi:hypothetical protein
MAKVQPNQECRASLPGFVIIRHYPPRVLFMPCEGERWGGSKTKVSDRDIRKDIRRAVYDLVWQTAHLYKDAPGGKLACSQRSRLARYVDGKMMTFDFMLRKAEDKSEFIKVAVDFLKGLEEDFKMIVYQEKEHLSFYEETKRHCLEAISGRLGK